MDIVKSIFATIATATLLFCHFELLTSSFAQKITDMETIVQSTDYNWITVDQLERKLNISRSTVYRWMRLNIIRAYRFNNSRNLYFLDAEVDAFLRGNPIMPSGRLDKVGWGG